MKTDFRDKRNLLSQRRFGAWYRLSRDVLPRFFNASPISPSARYFADLPDFV